MKDVAVFQRARVDFRTINCCVVKSPLPVFVVSCIDKVFSRTYAPVEPNKSLERVLPLCGTGWMTLGEFHHSFRQFIYTNKKGTIESRIAKDLHS